MLFKATRTEVKADTTKREITAYASVFHKRDTGGDIVMPGFFAKTLKENSDRVRALWQHAWNLPPVGTPVTMEEDSKGLLTVTKMLPTPRGEEILICAQEGAINELSFGYDVTKKEEDETKKTRTLLEGILWEYSFVNWGMQQLARVAGIKSLDDLLLNMEVMDELKSGRILSSRNRAAIADVVATLQALLANADGDTSSTSDDDQTDDDSKNKALDQSNGDEPPPDEKPDDLHLSSMEASVKAFCSNLDLLAMQRDISHFVAKH